MDIDEAWNAFQESRSIKKASISEKLDTIAAQLNEIQTDSSRTAELIPKILGDDSAIEASNAQAPPMDPSMMGGMGGMPPMGEDPMGGAVPGAEDMGPGGMDLGTGDGMTDDIEMPMDEETPEEPLGDEGAPADMGMGMPEEGLGGDVPVDEGLPTGDMSPVDEGMAGAGDTVDVLMEILHQKVDERDMASVKALADAIEQMSGEVVAGDGLGAPMEDIPLENGPLVDEGMDFGKSAALSGAGPVEQDVSVPTQASANDANKSDLEKVMDVLSDAQAEVAEIMNGDAPEEPPVEGEVEIEIEAEPEESSEEESEDKPEPEEAEEEKSPEADLSDKGEAPFKENADECGADMPMTAPSTKSAMDLSFREVLMAKLNGQDLVADFVQKSGGESEGYSEIDPWGVTRRSQMFAKNNGSMGVGDSGASNPTEPTEPVKLSATVADEVEDPKSKMSGKHDGTDSTTVADDIKEPMDHTKGSANGGEPLDDVGEKKGTSDHSVAGGVPLDDVDEKKGTSDHKVGDDDLIDDVDEKKGTSDHSVKGGDLLSELHNVRKSCMDTGIEVPSMRDMLSVKKAQRYEPSRPDATVTLNGDLERPELGKLQKSLSPEPVRMGQGVDPHKVVEADWAEYNLYKAQHGL